MPTDFYAWEQSLEGDRRPGRYRRNSNRIRMAPDWENDPQYWADQEMDDSGNPFFPSLGYPDVGERWQNNQPGYYQDQWDVPGPHRGRGPRIYQRSDQNIQDDICERLTSHGYIDASDIEIQVDNGDVTLSGTTATRKEKRLAEDIADSVRGVKDIHNRIHLTYGKPSTISNPVNKYESQQPKQTVGNQPENQHTNQPAANQSENRQINQPAARQNEEQKLNQPTVNQVGSQPSNQPAARQNEEQKPYQPAVNQVGSQQSNQPAARKPEAERLNQAPVQQTKVEAAQPPDQRVPDEHDAETIQTVFPDQTGNHKPESPMDNDVVTRKTIGTAVDEGRRTSIQNDDPTIPIQANNMKEEPGSRKPVEGNQNANQQQIIQSSDPTIPVFMDDPSKNIERQPSVEKTPHPPTGQEKNQVRTGMQVLGYWSEEVGTVKEVRENDFLLNRSMARDLYVPFSAIKEIRENKVVLQIPAEEIGTQGWQNSSLF